MIVQAEQLQHCHEQTFSCQNFKMYNEEFSKSFFTKVLQLQLLLGNGVLHHYIDIKDFNFLTWKIFQENGISWKRNSYTLQSTCGHHIFFFWRQDSVYEILRHNHRNYIFVISVLIHCLTDNLHVGVMNLSNFVQGKGETMICRIFLITCKTKVLKFILIS